MHISKPDDALIMLGYQSLGGQPSLTVTIGYVCESDGTRMSEQDAWAWLLPQFTDEPFDIGLKRRRGAYAVCGSACAPGGKPVPGLIASASVGSLKKSVLVQGDRTWTQGALTWRASEPQPFVTMPLDLAHAYGGKAWTANPYGIGHVLQGGEASGVRLPNVEMPSEPVFDPAVTPQVATLRALPQSSPLLARWLGSFDRSWQRTRFPWLPDDTDPRWFDRMPQDQCAPEYWRGDEAWSATHMHPEFPALAGHLPALRPRLLWRSHADPEQRREIALDLDTVWLFPNVARVAVLYRAQIEVRWEDASDVAGLAAFTETQAEPLRPESELADIWRRQIGTPVTGDAATAATDAAAAEIGAAARARISAELARARAGHAAAVGKTVGDAHSAELDALALSSRTMVRPTDQPTLDRALAALRAGVPTVKDPEINVATAEAYVKSLLAQGDAEARAHLAGYRIDVDAALARAEAQASSTADPDLHGLLNGMPEGDAKKAVLAQWQAFNAAIEEARRATAPLASAPKAPADQKESVQAGQGGPADEGATAERRRLDREMLQARHRSGLPTAWSELEDLDLSALDLSGVDLSHSVLRRCRFAAAILDKADLTEAHVEDCDFGAARLARTRWTRAQILNSRYDHAMLAEADFSQARVSRSHFSAAILSASIWERADVRDCDYARADLKRFNASNASFVACDLSAASADGAVLDRTAFEHCKLDAICLDDALMTHVTLNASRAIGARFTRARLSGLRALADADLSKSCFNGADLTGASLQDTLLVGTQWREARMDHALVARCDLTGSDAWHVAARHADFTGSRIARADWRGANLMHARFARAVLQDLDLSGCNLHGASTRTAMAQGVLLKQALLSRCRLLMESADG